MKDNILSILINSPPTKLMAALTNYKDNLGSYVILEEEMNADAKKSYKDILKKQFNKRDYSAVSTLLELLMAFGEQVKELYLDGEIINVIFDALTMLLTKNPTAALMSLVDSASECISKYASVKPIIGAKLISVLPSILDSVASSHVKRCAVALLVDCISGCKEMKILCSDADSQVHIIALASHMIDVRHAVLQATLCELLYRVYCACNANGSEYMSEGWFMATSYPPTTLAEFKKIKSSTYIKDSKQFLIWLNTNSNASDSKSIASFAATRVLFKSSSHSFKRGLEYVDVGDALYLNAFDEANEYATSEIQMENATVSCNNNVLCVKCGSDKSFLSDESAIKNMFTDYDLPYAEITLADVQTTERICDKMKLRFNVSITASVSTAKQKVSSDRMVSSVTKHSLNEIFQHDEFVASPTEAPAAIVKPLQVPSEVKQSRKRQVTPVKPIEFKIPGDSSTDAPIDKHLASEVVQEMPPLAAPEVDNVIQEEYNTPKKRRPKATRKSGNTPVMPVPIPQPLVPLVVMKQATLEKIVKSAPAPDTIPRNRHRDIVPMDMPMKKKKLADALGYVVTTPSKITPAVAVHQQQLELPVDDYIPIPEPDPVFEQPQPVFDRMDEAPVVEMKSAEDVILEEPKPIFQEAKVEHTKTILKTKQTRKNKSNHRCTFKEQPEILNHSGELQPVEVPEVPQLDQVDEYFEKPIKSRRLIDDGNIAPPPKYSMPVEIPPMDVCEPFQCSQDFQTKLDALDENRSSFVANIMSEAQALSHSQSREVMKAFKPFEDTAILSNKKEIISSVMKNFLDKAKSIKIDLQNVSSKRDEICKVRDHCDILENSYNKSYQRHQEQGSELKSSIKAL